MTQSNSSKLCRGYLERAGVDRMEWPSQSPDLNPIENLWSILDDTLKDRRPANEEELFEVLSEGWKSIETDLLHILAHSMTRRCQAVIDAKGFATKY